jgi:hypothetical protein
MQVALGFVVASGLVALLIWQYVNEGAKRAEQGRVLFQSVFSLFQNPDLLRGSTAGVWTLVGRYRDHNFQLKTIVDTLATRKLPSLWFMVTMPEPLPLTATTDLMMRAAGVSSFSNFDFLPYTLPLPVAFPEQATVKSDVKTPSDVLSLMVCHLDIFQNGRGKEFLISPQGLRVVTQLAEGDRARYGVFREANFGGTSIDVELVRKIMDTLVNLKHDILNHVKS